MCVCMRAPRRGCLRGAEGVSASRFKPGLGGGVGAGVFLHIYISVTASGWLD